MNVKLGDLAIVIHSLQGKSIGMVVTVGAYLGSAHRQMDCWECKFQHKIELESGHISKIAMIPDAWLRSVSGIPDTDTTETTKDMEIAE